jgi:hypothetical protein
LAGCSSLNNVAGYFALASDASGQDRLVAGSLESVAQSTQGTLSQLGFSASQSQRGDSIYISSKTATGASFTLVLTRAKQADGSEKTKIHLDWNGAKDDQTGVHILGQLDGTTRR